AGKHGTTKEGEKQKRGFCVSPGRREKGHHVCSVRTRRPSWSIVRARQDQPDQRGRKRWSRCGRHTKLVEGGIREGHPAARPLTLSTRARPLSGSNHERGYSTKCTIARLRAPRELRRAV